jgi:transcriptional regulator GlxA family with amidase domain
MTQSDSLTSINVGVLIFDDVELLDFAGPFEVFSVASKIQSKYPLNVFTISEFREPVITWNSVSINSDFTIENHPSIDVFVMPGGVGTKALLNEDEIMNWIKNSCESAKWTMGVCSSTRVFMDLGLLKGKPYCTHQSVYQELIQSHSDAIPNQNKRFVQSTDKLYTSAGVSAGIDLAFHILEKITDTATKKLVETYMEYYSNNG